MSLSWSGLWPSSSSFTVTPRSNMAGHRGQSIGRITRTLLQHALVAATSLALSTHRYSDARSTPTSHSLLYPCTRPILHRTTTCPSRPSPRTTLRLIRSTIHGGLLANTLLRQHPPRARLPQSIMVQRVLGLRLKVTRVAPCSVSLPCLSPPLRKRTSNRPITAHPPTPLSTPRLLGTSMVSVADVLTVCRGTRPTTWHLVTAPRLLPSNHLPSIGRASQQHRPPDLSRIHIRHPISALHMFKSYSSVSRSTMAYLSPLSSDHWIHSATSIPSSLDYRTFSRRNCLIPSAICKHIGAPPDLTKTH